MRFRSASRGSPSRSTSLCAGGGSWASPHTSARAKTFSGRRASSSGSAGAAWGARCCSRAFGDCASRAMLTQSSAASAPRSSTSARSARRSSPTARPASTQTRCGATTNLNDALDKRISVMLRRRSRTMSPRLALIFLFAVSLASSASASRAARAVVSKSAIRNPQSAIARVAVLDLGKTETGARVSERLAKMLAGAARAQGGTRLVMLDRGLGAAAARGVGYRGSLNVTLAEARNLGAAIGCDFYVTGDAQTIRRSSSARPVYFESYASVFVVSARTGRLVLWERPAAEADRPEQAEGYFLAARDASAGPRQ